ncbi:MAG: holo-ACP synthase [Burkholderiales bacterium]
MIYGIGTDLCRISRIEKSLGRFGERFAAKILCDDELAKFRAHRAPAAYLAKRFAAKEAFSKAIGTGMRYPVHWRNIGVANEKSGKPIIRCLGPLTAVAEARGIAAIHLSLTDEPDFALAFVILEKQ